MTPVATMTFPHAVGWITVGCGGRGICLIDLHESKPSHAQLQRRHPRHRLTEDAAAARAAKEVVLAWFETGAFEGDLDVSGTPFQAAVWRALRRIPRGRTLTYRQLAAAAGNAEAVRAAGSACGANPVPLLIPCHRVIRSDGALGGFGPGPAIKAKLLAWENGAYHAQYRRARIA